jgi:hypothetical protein
MGHSFVGTRARRRDHPTGIEEGSAERRAGSIWTFRDNTRLWRRISSFFMRLGVARIRGVLVGSGDVVSIVRGIVALSPLYLLWNCARLSAAHNDRNPP